MEAEEILARWALGASLCYLLWAVLNAMGAA